MNDIKLFITDIDGVWTDGGMYYDQLGNEWKKFNTSDSAGVLFLKIINIPLAIISGEDTEIVRRRAKKLKIEYVFLGVKNKVNTAQELINKLGIAWENVAFIGDDINDFQLLSKVGLSATPINAPIYIKEKVNWVIPVKGGDGVFRAFIEKYLREINQLNNVLDKYLHKTSKFYQ